MNYRKWVWGTIAFLITLVSGSMVFIAAADQENNTGAYWIENQGQFASEVLFRSEGTHATAWVLADAIWLSYAERGPGRTISAPNSLADTGQPPVIHSVRLRFDQAPGSFSIAASDPVDLVRNFVTPAGAFNDAPTWSSLRLGEVAPSVQLEARIENGHIVLSLDAGPGHTGPLRIQVDGADSIRTEEGQLWLSTQAGEGVILFESDTPGLVVEATGSGDAVVFPREAGSPPAAGADTPSSSTQIYGGFHGIPGQLEFGNAIAIDADQNAYIAGSVEAPVPASPTEIGARDPQHLVSTFVLKLNPAGTGVEYLTTITGFDPNGEEFAQDIVLDGDRNAYITGMTSSTDFPTTVGAYDTTPNQNGMFDGWVVKLNPSGGLVFSTVIGTNAHDLSYGIGLGLFNQVVIAGFTGGAAFPTTPGAFDTSHNGGFDTFVSIFSNDGSTLLRSSLLGGSADDGGLFFERVDLSIDRVGSVFLAGPTQSLNFPTTENSIGPGGCTDMHITKFSPSLSNIYFATRIGGSGTSCGVNGDEFPQRMIIEGSGNIYVTGYTSTTQGSGFPVTAGAYDTTYNGGAYDAFMLKFNATTLTVRYGTYLGGNSVDVGKDIQIEKDGFLYLTGYTYSTNFPTTVDAFDPVLSGPNDAYLMKLSTEGFGATDLVYSSFIGGSSTDESYALEIYGTDIVFLTGLSTSADFPTIPGSWDTIFSGDRDAFAALFHLSEPDPPHPVETWTPAPENILLPIAPNQND